MTHPTLEPNYQLSDRVLRIDQALSIYMNQVMSDLRAKGRDIIALSQGEAYFDIPLFDFGKLNKDSGFHYTDSRGTVGLRRKIAAYYDGRYGAKVDPESEMLVTAGSKPAIFMAMQAILNLGDEVLIHEPAWLSYKEHAKLLDARASFIPYDCQVAEFEKYISDRTRILVLNNPNNPSGRVYSSADLQLAVTVCRTRGIYLLVDEAYSDFVDDGTFQSIAAVADDLRGIVVVNSLSKNMGMSGWRIGYLMSDQQLINAVLKLNQHIITCAPSILSNYLAEYFDELLSITLPQVSEVVAKRGRVARMLIDKGLSCLAGTATFYFFIGLQQSPNTDEEIALTLLLDHGIAVVPGSAYGVSTNRFLRVSIGTESEERIELALDLIKQVIDGPKVDRKQMISKMRQFNLPLFREEQAEIIPVAAE